MKNISELSTKDLTNNKVVSSIRKNPLVATYAIGNGVLEGVAVKAAGYSLGTSIVCGVAATATAGVLGYCIKLAYKGYTNRNK